MTKFIERHNFVFDEVFDSDATNEDVRCSARLGE